MGPNGLDPRCVGWNTSNHTSSPWTREWKHFRYFNGNFSIVEWVVLIGLALPVGLIVHPVHMHPVHVHPVHLRHSFVMKPWELRLLCERVRELRIPSNIPEEKLCNAHLEVNERWCEYDDDSVFSNELVSANVEESPHRAMEKAARRGTSRSCTASEICWFLNPYQEMVNS